MQLAQQSFQDTWSDQLVKRAKIDGATSGNNTLVAAVTGKKIRVLALTATMTGTAVTIRFEDGAGGTALTGQMGPIFKAKWDAILGLGKVFKKRRYNK